ncbi:MAG: hypothetical protein A2Y38_08235 [Spirochaetes bacterium GWB1_59_5]|nr:MAG: hypothetical protein A2Y38_08235 [Spirochaetes bacterium GWB1_59_5]
MGSGDEFYAEYGQMFASPSGMDQVIQGREIEGSHFTSMRELTAQGRKASALPLPVKVGTRVAFRTNLGSVLTYPDVPNTGVLGTVVLVRTANGDSTEWEGRVMVAWDDGKFRPILAEHLRPALLKTKQARMVRLRVSSLGDLSEFFGPAKTGSSDLVHKATQDLWAFHQDGEGYVIERLFNADGNPLHGV